MINLRWIVCAVLLVGWGSASDGWAQVIYLSERIGTGSEEDPFRAHWPHKKTVNCSQLGSVFVCQSSESPGGPGVVVIARGNTQLKQGDKSAIEALTRRAGKETVSDVIFDLVDTNAIGLIQQKDGRQRVVVGGVEIAARKVPVASILIDAVYTWARQGLTSVSDLLMGASAFAASLLTETFNCTDDTDGVFTCDHSWTRAAGTNGGIVSSTLRAVNSTSLNRWRVTSTALDSTNMTVRVTVSTIARGTATDVSGGPIARNPSDGTSTYVYCVLRDGASDEVEYGKVVTGTLTALGTSSVSAADGDTLEFTALGDQISCSHNSSLVLGPTTETTGSGNLYTGARFSGSGTATTTLVALDNYTASEATTGGILRRRQQ